MRSGALSAPGWMDRLNYALGSPARDWVQCWVPWPYKRPGDVIRRLWRICGRPTVMLDALMTKDGTYSSIHNDVVQSINFAVVISPLIICIWLFMTFSILSINAYMCKQTIQSLEVIEFLGF